MSSETSRGSGPPPTNLNEGGGRAAPPHGGQTKQFAYPPLPPPFGFGGGVTPRDAATPTPEQPIVRQHEEISEIDHFLEQWRNDQNKAKEDAVRNATLKRRLKPVKWAAAVLSVGALSVHAAGIAPSYQRASVVGKTGDVSIHPVLPGAALPDTTLIGKPLAEGETISQSDLPLYITTGANSGVTLGLAGGEAVYIAANSLAEVRELAYEGGPIRRFILWGGRMGVRTQPSLSGKERFTLETGGMKCDAPGDTRLSLTSVVQDGAPFVRLATRQGKAQVVYPGGESEVHGGEQVSVWARAQQSLKEPIPPGDTSLAEEDRMLAAAPSPSEIIRFLGSLEEGVIVPLIQPIRALLAMPDAMKDTQKVTVAVAHMQALCSLTVAGDSENGVPATLDLETLAPLSVPREERTKLMSGFVNNRLYSYRTLPNGGYEILARANDTRHTWIRGKNGGATTAGTQTEAQK